MSPESRCFHMTDGMRYGSYESTRECKGTYGSTATDVNGDAIGCQFYGDVEVFYDADTYHESWSCPVCGYENEEEFDDS